MASLIETSMIVRLTNDTDAGHALARKMLLELHRQQEKLYTTAQIFVEFRNVATRPKDVNGLGFTADEAEAKAQIYE